MAAVAAHGAHVCIRRRGVCRERAKCRYVHDRSKVAVCPAWLQGRCPLEGAVCPLQHERRPDLMPVCSFFLQVRTALKPRLAASERRTTVMLDVSPVQNCCTGCSCLQLRTCPHHKCASAATELLRCGKQGFVWLPMSYLQQVMSCGIRKHPYST